ncbi:MAG: glutamate--tRNA ligase [Thermodesulfovibrionales bacterium]
MSSKVRVRFAPSPTGHLHIGGARTALFNWLFARHNKGVFILRIEDTDRSRSTEEYIEAIIEGMKWLGLDWDEGPYRQTDRLEIYKSYVDKLLKEGKAYYCYCLPEELEERRRLALAQGKPPKYDGRCRELKAPVPGRIPAVRFKMPQFGITAVDDLIRGKVSFDNEQLDDFIIMRSDGTPTYNFCVVVDDVDMRITHVIRGDDHLNNTPKQIQIYRALNYELPQFAHLPMILGSDKTRLSKRHGATSVMAYKEMGYLPEALLNYLVRLGWSYKDQEIFSKEELIEKFTLENIGKSAAVFNPEKLLWLNSHYINASTPERLYELVRPFLIKEGIIKEDTEIDIQWISKAIATLKERSRTLVELANSLRYYILEDIEIDEEARQKFINEKTIGYLRQVRELLISIDGFESKPLEEAFKKLISELGVKLSEVAQPLRVALTGKTVSPPIFDVLSVLGKERALRRLDRVIETS